MIACRVLSDSKKSHCQKGTPQFDTSSKYARHVKLIGSPKADMREAVS